LWQIPDIPAQAAGGTLEDVYLAIFGEDEA